MMKKLLLLPILLLSLSAFSQENWETTFKGGINCSFLSSGVSSSGSKAYLGATAGLEQTYYFDNSIFSAQSGLEFENIGSGINSIGITVGGSNSGRGTLSRENANYLTIPLHLKCQINERWGALAGTGYRFGLGDRQSGNSRGRDDISLDAGFFYKLNKMRFNLIYQHGLKESNLVYPMKQSKNRTITFTVSTSLWGK